MSVDRCGTRACPGNLIGPRTAAPKMVVLEAEEGDVPVLESSVVGRVQESGGPGCTGGAVIGLEGPVFVRDHRRHVQRGRSHQREREHGRAEREQHPPATAGRERQTLEAFIQAEEARPQQAGSDNTCEYEQRSAMRCRERLGAKRGPAVIAPAGFTVINASAVGGTVASAPLIAPRGLAMTR